MIRCPTRDEMLAAELPYEVHSMSVHEPTNWRAPMVTRYRSAEARQSQLDAERAALFGKP